MQRVIHQSIVFTLEIRTSGVTKFTAERATAAIASEWLRYIGQQFGPSVIPTHARPTYQLYVRQLPLEQGAQIQILLCWIGLQAHRREISDFERV